MSNSAAAEQPTDAALAYTFAKSICRYAHNFTHVCREVFQKVERSLLNGNVANYAATITRGATSVALYCRLCFPRYAYC